MFLLIEPTAAALVETACARLERLVARTIAECGCFRLVLAGGTTPQALYERLASPDWAERFDWAKIEIYFGDERAVAPDDALSNFKMAREALLSRVPILESNIHRFLAETHNLELAAREYEAQLRASMGPLALVLLGMGGDGHTASLFPNFEVLSETERLCVATPVAPLEPHVPRLTLTFSALNAAREVWVLVTGASKAERLYSVLCGPENVREQPIQGVLPASGNMTWMLDEAAASLLPK